MLYLKVLQQHDVGGYGAVNAERIYNRWSMALFYDLVAIYAPYNTIANSNNNWTVNMASTIPNKKHIKWTASKRIRRVLDSSQPAV